MAKRQCQGETKTGKPCESTSLIGDFCFAHQPKEVREAHGFGGAQPGSGRPRNPRVVDVLRERIEREIDDSPILRALWDGLVAERALPLGVKGGGETVRFVPDHPTRIMAARELLDRAYGKPKVVTEVSGPEGVPLLPPAPTRERIGRFAELMEQVGVHEGRKRRKPSSSTTEVSDGK